MTAEWLSGSADPGGIADLVVRRKWSKAIDILRARLLDGQVPSVQGRLQLADLLVMAGRGREAVPVLLGLADEFAAEHFVAKAIAILKRVERIEPGRPDVGSRVAALVETQSRLVPERPTARPPGPLFDMEDVSDESGAVVSPSPEAVDGGSVDAGVPGEEAPGREADPEREPEPAFSATEPQAGTEGPGMTERLRGVLKRFLGFGPSAEGELHENEAPLPAEPEPEEDGPVAVAAVPFEPDDPDRAGGEDAFPEDRLRQPIPSHEAPSSEGLAMTPPASATPGAASQPTSLGEAAAPTGGEPSAVAEVEPEVEPEPDREGGPVEADVEVQVEPELDGTSGSAQPASVEVEPDEDETPSSAVAEVAERAPWMPGSLLELGHESDELLEGQILDLVEDVLRRPTPAAPSETTVSPVQAEVAVAARLVAVPLFGGLSSAELLAVVRGLVLRTFEPGDALVTEGERGRSLFILSSGRARVFVRSRDGHAVEVAHLEEGDFFGEASALSGGRRGATITAAARCEVLELDKSTLDEIARAHPRVREMLEETYVKRASDPETAAVRAADLAVRVAPARAQEVLEARFGEARWDPRMRLRLADVLLKAGQYDEAVPILVNLVDELARHGFPEKAIAVVKKIERIQQRHVEELPLAPLVRPEGDRGPRPSEVAAEVASSSSAEHPFERWLVHLAREVVERPRQPRQDVAAPRGYGPGLKASPLFEDFSEDELLELVRQLRLVSFQSGQIIVSEGEQGQSLFVVATGAVKVSVRDAAGRSIALGRLEEGAFFGEIATLSGRPRSATVTAAAPSELLELDRAALDAITASHPRVREILENAYLERAGALTAERAKTSS